MCLVKSTFWRWEVAFLWKFSGAVHRAFNQESLILEPMHPSESVTVAIWLMHLYWIKREQNQLDVWAFAHRYDRDKYFLLGELISAMIYSDRNSYFCEWIWIRFPAFDFVVTVNICNNVKHQVQIVKLFKSSLQIIHLQLWLSWSIGSGSLRLWHITGIAWDFR